MRKINIAIDGYSACGKSTTAKGVAAALRYTYIDTGAMYRSVTLSLLRAGSDLTSGPALDRSLEKIDIQFTSDDKGQQLTMLNGEIVEEEIRGMAVAEKVSEVSAIAQVRSLLVAQQQKMGAQKGVVMDGRDIGTVVFPDAELKVFMTADPEVRAERRQLELRQKGQENQAGRRAKKPCRKRSP